MDGWLDGYKEGVNCIIIMYRTYEPNAAVNSARDQTRAVSGRLFQAGPTITHNNANIFR